MGRRNDERGHGSRRAREKYNRYPPFRFRVTCCHLSICRFSRSAPQRNWRQTNSWSTNHHLDSHTSRLPDIWSLGDRSCMVRAINNLQSGKPRRFRYVYRFRGRFLQRYPSSRIVSVIVALLTDRKPSYIQLLPATTKLGIGQAWPIRWTGTDLLKWEVLRHSHMTARDCSLLGGADLKALGVRQVSVDLVYLVDVVPRQDFQLRCVINRETVKQASSREFKQVQSQLSPPIHFRRCSPRKLRNCQSYARSQEVLLRDRRSPGARPREGGRTRKSFYTTLTHKEKG